MEFGDRQETRLLMDDELPSSSSSSSSSFPPFSSTCLCRICHDEEEESSSSMESPCGCSGTLKFAHRECIQRWCDEKGSNVCEICLQVFEPGYTVPEKKALVEVVVTIRESSEISRLNYDTESPGFITASDDAAEANYAECYTASQKRASYYRSVAIMFTVMLLIRHFFAVITVGADHFALSILTVILLRASGIVLPSYLVLRFISAIQQAQLQYQLEQIRRVNPSMDRLVEEDDLEHHLIQIDS